MWVDKVLLSLATLIMIYDVYIFIRLVNSYKEILHESFEKIKFLSRFYIFMLLCFIVEYMVVLWFSFCFHRHSHRLSNVEVILNAKILFWGSIFVLLTINMTKILVKEILKIKLAETDSMTGLFNKISGEKNMSIQLKKEGMHYAMLIIDLDNFKQVNDYYGHMSGDDIIKQMARIIRNSIDGEDICSHFGGDEFVALIRLDHNGNERQIAQLIIERVQHLAKQYEEAPFSCSIGVAKAVGGINITYQDLFRKADKALYEAKRAGKARYSIYQE